MIRESGKGRIAVIGERNLSLGFKLIGISDSYDEIGTMGVERLINLISSKEYSMIFVSESLREHMDRKLLFTVETSTNPLIMFIPLPGVNNEESLSELAKRVLGIDLNR
ncbi:MAG: V-type ATP synthase subunit F [Thermoplasmataceae archaeon]